MPINENKIKQAKQEAWNKSVGSINAFSGNKTAFSPRQSNMSRYLTYGSKVYGELGFDPTKDNNALYNANTSALDDVSRGFYGAMKLAGIGFKDTFAFGATKNQNSSFAFEEVMNNYGSTRGGLAEGFSNTLLSSGYTAGILGAIAAEELLLTGATALTGGFGAGAQGVETASVLARAGNAIGNANQVRKTLEAVKGASQIKNARSLTSSLKALNPLENTFEFVKNVDKVENVSKTVLGAGALVRDMRKIYMAHSESKLESEMAYREFFNSEYDKALKKSDTGSLDNSQVSEIENRSRAMADKVYAGNFQLIYGTNALAFDNMFKTMKGGNNLFKQMDNGFFKKTINKETNEVLIEALEKPMSGFKRYALQQAKDFTSLRAWGNTALSSSMEGLQELGQDIISEGSKNYYSKQKNVNQVKGGFFNTLLEDFEVFTDGDYLSELGNASKDMMSWKGLTTFLSGALMGGFASPVGLATHGVSSYLTEGGLSNTIQKVRDSKAFKETQAKNFKTRKEKAAVLTELFNNTKNFTDFVEHPLFTQKQYESDMDSAVRSGDDFEFKNVQSKAFAESIWTMLESNMHEEFKQHMNYMAENFDVEELKQVFNRQDITEENADDFRKKLRDRTDKIDEYKARYDAVNSEFKNPIQLSTVDSNSPEFLDQYLKYKAYDSLRKDLVVSQAQILDHADRLSQLKTDMLDFTKGAPAEQISQFYNMTSINSELEMLDNLIKSTANFDLDPKLEAKLKEHKERMDALNTYKKSFENFQSALESQNINDINSSQEKLYKEFKKLNGFQFENKSVHQIDQAFTKLVDYMRLTKRVSDYQKHVDVLSGFEGREATAKLKEKYYKELESTKDRHILAALANYEEKQISDDMLNELYDEGLFFDLRELDDLLKNGTAPSKIYAINENRVATPEERVKSQEIIKQYVAKLKKLDLIDSNINESNRKGKRSTIDNRTVSDLIDEYDLSLQDSEFQIDLNSERGRQFIEDLIQSPYSFTADELLFEKVQELGTNVILRFTTSGTQAVDYLGENVYVIDLKFLGSEYKASFQTSFESLIGRVLIQDLIQKNIDNIDQGVIKTMMDEVREKFKDTLTVDLIDALSSPESFLSEALNNYRFQKMLDGLQLSSNVSGESLWSEMYDAVKEYMGETYDGSALNQILSLLKQTIDEVPIDQNSKVLEDDQVDSTTEENQPNIDESTIEELKNLRNILMSKIQNLNADFKNATTRKERKRINRELLQVGNELNDVLDKLELETAKSEVKLENQFSTESGGSEIPDLEMSTGTIEYDRFGNRMITPDTSWVELPLDFKDHVSNILFGKDSKYLKRDEVLELLDNLKNNPFYYDQMTQYNSDVTFESEIEHNQRVMTNRELEKRKRLEAESAQKSKSRKVVSKTMFEDYLKSILGDDFKLLTDKELADFRVKLKTSKSSLTPFTIQDVLNYVANKVAAKELKKRKRDIVKQSIIRKNVASVTSGKRRIVIVENGKRKYKTINLTEQGLQYLKLHYPSVFLSSDFKRDFDQLLNTVFANADREIKILKSGTSSEKPVDIFNRLQKKHLLLPHVVKELNKLFDRNQEPIRVVKERGVLSYRMVPAVRKNKVVKLNSKPNLTPIQKAKNELYDFISTMRDSQNELVQKAIVALGLETNKITPELLELIVLRSGISPGSRKMFTSKDSRINSRDGLADQVSQDYVIRSGEGSVEFMDSEDVLRLHDVIDQIILDYKTPLTAIKEIAKEIRYEMSRLMSDEIMSSFEGDDETVTADEIEYYASEEGSQNIEQMLDQQNEYYNSVEFKIESGLYTGQLSDLTDAQKQLYAIALSQGLYSDNSISEIQQRINELNAELNDLQQSDDYKSGEFNALDRSMQIEDDLKLLNTTLEINTDSEIVDPISSFMDEELSPVSEAMLDINSQMSMNDRFNYNNVNMLSTLIKQRNTSLTTMIAISRIVTQSIFTLPQKEKLKSQIEIEFKSGRFSNQTTIVKGEVYWLQKVSSQKGTALVSLKSLNQDVIEMPLSNFIYDFENTVEGSDLVVSEGINTTVAPSQIDFIKATFSENLNTFNPATDQTFDSVVEVLKKHVQNCK